MYPPPGKRQSLPKDKFNGAVLHFLDRRYEYVTKNRGNAGLVFMHNFIQVKPGLNIFSKVVTIAQHACDRVLKRFESCQHIDCKYFLQNKNTCDHYNYVKPVSKHVLAILATFTETRL